jgi:hypothetical protein
MFGKNWKWTQPGPNSYPSYIPVNREFNREFLIFTAQNGDFSGNGGAIERSGSFRNRE